MTSRTFPAVFSVFLLCSAPAFAAKPKFSSDQALIAMGLCEDMAVKVNRLVEYTSTKCMPHLSTQGTDFIFISEQPVFSVEPSKKAWIIVVIASVGKTLNDKSSYSAGKILVADLSMVPSKHYYAISASLAKRLQRKVYTGEITVDTMWDTITAALKPFP